MGGGLSHRLNKNEAVMIKENDLASMYQELGDNSSRIAHFLQEVDINTCGAFLEIETREQKEALTAAAIWNQKEIDDKPIEINFIGDKQWIYYSTFRTLEKKRSPWGRNYERVL